MATSLTVAIAFDAGNLLPVSKAMRERFPGCPLIICRDDDWKTKRPNGDPWNPGEEKANNAALVVGGQVVAPVFSGGREIKWTDFNDLHVAEGWRPYAARCSRWSSLLQQVVGKTNWPAPKTAPSLRTCKTSS